MLHKQKFEKLSWLGTIQDRKLATYQGNYFVICSNCKREMKKSSKSTKIIQYKKNGDFTTFLNAHEINEFKENHEDHKWTILHESRFSKNIIEQMIRGKYVHK